MTKKQCYRCHYYNESNERNCYNIRYIQEWCDISKAHNKYLMRNIECPYFKDDFIG